MKTGSIPTEARTDLGIVLSLATVANAGMFGGYFLADDCYGLHVFGRASLADVLGNFTRLITAPAGERVHPVIKAHLRLGMALFGTWYPGHAALALAVHLGVAGLVFLLARRLLPSSRALPIAAGLLMGLSPASVDLGWLVSVQHTYLALAAALLGLAYLRFRERPTREHGTPVVLAALFAVVVNEAGPAATLVPLLLELALASARPRSEGPDAPSVRARRLGIVAAALAIGALRASRELTPAVLGGRVALETANPEHYLVDLRPSVVVDHLLTLATDATFLPRWALPALALLALLGIRSPQTRPAAVFGAALAVVLAVPMCILRGPPWYWYAYAPSVGLALVAVAGVGALLELGGKPARAIAALALAAVLVAFVRVPAGYRAERRHLADQQRAIVSGLARMLPPSTALATLVLHGVPTREDWPDHPLLLNHSIPLLVPERRFARVLVIVPELRELLDLDDTKWRPRADWNDVAITPVYAFRLVDTELRPCADLACAAFADVAAPLARLR